MGLPSEMLPFAENFYRRFPEEFVALGMPGLEDLFDLRVDGSRSRRIYETPMEKKVEVTIRRWPVPHPAANGHVTPQAPSMQGWANRQWQFGSCCTPPVAPYMAPPPIGPMAGGAAFCSAYLGYPSSAPYATMPMAPMQPPPPQPPPRPTESEIDMATTSAAEDRATARLVRLEAALTALKPQVEAILLSQARSVDMQGALAAAGMAAQPPGALQQAPPQATPQAPPQVLAQTQPQFPPQAFASGTVPADSARQFSPAARLPAGACAPDQKTEGEGNLSPGRLLRERRNLGHISIATPAHPKCLGSVQESEIALAPAAGSNAATAPTAASAVASASPPAVVASTAPVASLSEKKLKYQTAPPSFSTRPERPRVDPVRMAPSINDPESPRSPGRYSAWR
mmetsp:Transcript_48763/g.136440  ORF Transcript_48763/g.136440 Transcript_48763/m.136440 type:complete len:398 (+) Transcript_48763:65-1258(+)